MQESFKIENVLDIGIKGIILLSAPKYRSNSFPAILM